MTTARQQIIEKTSELLDRQGYHATGLNQIVAASETPRGSLYYYFPAGKEELAAEAIWYKAHQMSEHERRSLATISPAIEAIYQFVVSLADHAESQQCAAGAPIAAVALETSAASERLREACQAAYKLLQDPFEEKLLRGWFCPGPGPRIGRDDQRRPGRWLRAQPHRTLVATNAHHRRRD